MSYKILLERFAYLQTLKTTPKSILRMARRDFQSKRLQLRVAAQTKPARSRSYIKLGIGAVITSFVAYDGIVNEFTYCGATWRFLRSFKTAVLIAVDYLLLERHEDDANYAEQLSAVHRKSAKRLLETCLLNGGLYIKVGQGFAAINHILPKEYTATLTLLQEKCLPTSRQDVDKVFKDDFGKLPLDIYEEFDYSPVAAASLAQVFKAKLRNGEQVAVKVQYSDLQRRFASDLGTIIFLQDIIELFFKGYTFGWILTDLQKNLIQELNFRNEARNSERCAQDLARFSWVHIPLVHWKYTKTRVLTLEWIEGFNINDMHKIKMHKFNLKEIDTKLFQMFSVQIFQTGFVHADPHPGNVYLRRNPANGKMQLVLLDHGLYEWLPDQVRLPLCQFWEATVLRNEHKMKAAAEAIGIHNYMNFAQVLFQQPIQLHGGRVKAKLTEADIAYIQNLAKNNFDSIMNTLREMPRNMLFVVRNLNTIRAIGHHHGDVVDRPRIMAKQALNCACQYKSSMLSYVNWLYRRLKFEYFLWRNNMQLSIVDLYFKTMVKLGRAPESARTIMSDINRQSLT